MRIAYLVGEFPKLSESFIINQIVGMKKLGHDVRIFSIKQGDLNNVHPDFKKYNLLKDTCYINIPKNKVVRVLSALEGLININPKRYGQYGISLYNYYTALEFANQQKQFDVIHAYYGGRGIVGLYLKDCGVKGKLIVTFCGGDVLSKESKLYPMLFEKADKIIAITPFVKEELLKQGCPEKKIEIIGMGTDTEKFKPSKYFRSVMTHLLSVGRLAPEKGFEYSIKAVKKLLDAGYLVNYTLIGNGNEQSKLQELIGSYANIGIINNVSQKDLIKAYGLADIFILPSVSGTGSIEGQGVVLQEAQACGLPVIASNVGGIKYSLLDRQTGYLVPEKNVLALKEEIKYLIQNPNVRRRMGKSGRKFVEQSYSLKRLNRRLSNIYKEVCKDE